MSKGGHFLRKNEKKPLGRKKTVLIAAAVILILLIAAVAAVIAGFVGIADGFTQVSVPTIEYTDPTTKAAEDTQETTGETAVTTAATTEPHVASSADYINFLVVGQASRAGEAERFADTMILCTLNTYEKTLTLTSMQRDTLVQQSGKYGTHSWGGIKLTTVYHLGYQWDGIAGSMAVMNQTLYNNFGIEVDHNFEIDFDAFIKVVDLLGGVEIELTEAEADYLNKDDFWVYEDVEPGMQRLDGMTALSYARMRKAAGDNESDIIRTSRQRKLIEALLTKLKTIKISDLQAIANEVLPLITTSMSTSQITEMMLTLLPMLPELEIRNGGSCPAEHWGDMVDIYGDGMQHSVLKFDTAATKKYMRAITEGETE